MMLSDVVMPGRDGLSLLEDLRNLGITLPVVMISGQASIEMAVRATRLGAVDFLEKPLSTDKLLLTVDNVLKLKRLEDENRDLRQRVGKHEIVHSGEAMRRVMAQVERVAASEARVCILGETGTGKELIARALHERSPRRGGPFVTLNCAAVPGELIESELFGHEKGASPAPPRATSGKFEQASHGTLFLDEIGDMPLVMQAKLLRVLEERQVERVGGDRTIPVDVRVIVATHRNLDELVKKGAFRQDLYHRIYVFPLMLPPLRERAEDIPALVAHFAAQVSEQNGWKPKPFEPAAIQELQRYAWPGNVRELRNVVERLLLLAEGPVDVAAVRLALPATEGGSQAGAYIVQRDALRAHRRLRAGADPGGTQAPRPAHDRYREGARAGAKPSLQEVPGPGHRPEGDAPGRRRIIRRRASLRQTTGPSSPEPWVFGGRPPGRGVGRWPIFGVEARRRPVLRKTRRSALPQPGFTVFAGVAHPAAAPQSGQTPTPPADRRPWRHALIRSGALPSDPRGWRAGPGCNRPAAPRR